MAVNALFSFMAELIEFLGALLLVFYILRACRMLIWRRDIRMARLLVAEGALAALNFKLAGTLLRTIILQSWQQILMFLAIFALRTVLKYLFTWERKHLQGEQKAVL